MAVVVDQATPWAREKLDLDNPTRWNDLLPLIRPSIKEFKAGEQTILVDTSQASNDAVRIAAIGNSGDFSSKFLAKTHITAFVTELQPLAKPSESILTALSTHGIGVSQGLVIVRNGPEDVLDVLEDGVVEVKTKTELGLNHILALLEKVSDSVRSSLSQTTELLKHVLKNTTVVQSTFNEQKLDGKVSVVQETGHQVFESAKKALEKDLTHALRTHSSQENAVFSIHYADINGLAQLENYILAYEISDFLDAQSIRFDLSSSSLVSEASTSRGWAISVVPVSSEMLSPLPKPPNNLTQKANSSTTAKPSTSESSNGTLRFSDAVVRQRVESGCNAVIKAEPTITEYDTIVGDGDCGFTLRDGARKALEFVAERDLSQLPDVLVALVDDLEVTMGGTSGALYCIFLSALAQGLRSANSVSGALETALEQLLRYTNARKGDRTCLDCLIPYVETLKTSGDAGKAVEDARKGVEETKTLDAKLGRSSYLDEKATRGVPDPGAYGLLVLLEGLSST